MTQLDIDLKVLEERLAHLEASLIKSAKNINRRITEQKAEIKAKKSEIKKEKAKK